MGLSVVCRLSAFPLVAAGMMCGLEARAGTPVDLELALAVDVSRSIDAEKARLQRGGYVQAFRDAGVIDAIGSGMLGRIAVALFEWAGTGHTEVVVGWTLIEDKADAEAFADKLSRRLPSTARRTAIDFALPWFEANTFEGARRVIDISGDGPNNGGTAVTTARDRAVAAGVTINGLPILDDGGGLFSRFNIADLDLYYRDCVIGYYRDCVIGGPGAFLVVADSFRDFARAVRRKLILEIAGRTDARKPGFLPAQAAAKARASPPCDIGERLMRGREDF